MSENLNSCGTIPIKQSGLLPYEKVITLMTGPPLKKETDGFVVEKLMASPGVKIVCGSTTSEIVLRESKKEAQVFLSKDGRYPPVYKTSSVDLMTEGMITLNMVYEYMFNYKSKQDNVISVLGEMLMNSLEITFLIGTAKSMNVPTNKLLPRDLIMKKIIKFLTDKNINIYAEYF